MPEFSFKRRLIEQAQIKKNHRVLDLGCGTATLTILIKRLHPEVEVFGLDSDPKILEIGRAKIARACLDIILERGMASDLPHPDGSFDRILSSMLFHHLTLENKSHTLKEAFRVLRHGGELHVVDFGKPINAFMYLISLVMRRFEETAEHFKGLLPKMFQDAGFSQVEELARYATIFGTLSLYKARKLKVIEHSTK